MTVDPGPLKYSGSHLVILFVFHCVKCKHTRGLPIRTYLEDIYMFTIKYRIFQYIVLKPFFPGFFLKTLGNIKVRTLMELHLLLYDLITVCKYIQGYDTPTIEGGLTSPPPNGGQGQCKRLEVIMKS